MTTTPSRASSPCCSATGNERSFSQSPYLTIFFQTDQRVWGMWYQVSRYQGITQTPMILFLPLFAFFFLFVFLFFLYIIYNSKQPYIGAANGWYQKKPVIP